jgi:hypothetical protein
MKKERCLSCLLVLCILIGYVYELEAQVMRKKDRGKDDTPKSHLCLRGDTIVYVADSFAVSPGDKLEDLLRKLPNMHVNSRGDIVTGVPRVNTIYRRRRQ